MSSVVVHTPRFADVPVFAGQGTAAASSPQTREQALRDAESASGTLLLTACYQAFLTEFASLSPTEMEQVDIDPADFDTVQSLLAALPARYQRNTVFATTTLFLIQSLRYLAHIESLSTEKKTSPFADYLKSNAAQGLGVLGFSSGILPACVVGTSNTTVSYIAHAVEAYRLAFWIGVRCQLYRVAALEAEDAPGKECTLPWSLVFMGMNKKVAQDAIEEFQRKNTGLSPLYITAVMDDSSVTISGRPDVLAKFSAELPSGSSVHMTSITTLYHAPSHKEGVRSEILHDVIRRGIHFPTFAEIVFPIRSTYTGQLIDESCDVAAGYGTLVEAAVDMIVAQPVNWDIVVDEVIKALPAEGRIALLNLGPGAGMARSMERAFPKDKVVSIDISTRVAREASKIDTAKYEPIAVVGMAVNMPGAPNTNQLWEVLEKGINTISEVPSDRFDVRDYNDPKDPKTNRQMKAHTGNFLSNADQFDNKFFKISPREARSMDPQQRVLLHVAYEALENAGYVPNATETFAQDSFGCYIGVATNDYVQNLRNDIDVYYSTGTLRAFLSGRISYAFQWSGPSLVIDTACSSSMVAIYQACRALMNRDCNAALAGGVNVISSPDMFLGLDRGHFLSPTGQCKAFDASADGYSRSEGCGLFVLKRLSDAIAEGDNIMGVIRGIDVNQSGNAHSITHPHAPTQATLFKRVLEATGIDPTRINVVEAHGTGTQAGDPNELESIRSIFAIRRAKENPLHITSIKANIGHLEAASGSAGLAKLLLMLRHRAIPRQVSLKNLNPRIAPLEADNTIIDREMVPWEPSQPGLPRIAMLNNFGAAGSNGTMLLEEFPAADESKYEPAGLAYLFGLSAKTDTALNELKKKYVDWLQDPASDDVRFADIAYTATARRIMYAHRTAVVATDKKDLIQKLESTKLVAVPGESKPSKTVFVFSGQGGQYLGMGGELYRTNPLFKHHIDECHEVLRTMGFPGVTQIIATESGESGLSKLEEFEAYQGAIFALEYALAKLWMSWGVKPDAVVGHSLGEYAALVIAGVLTLKGALTIVANRVRLMVTKCATESTGMIAINQGPAAVKDILQSNAALSGCSIACYNSAGDCVVAGPLEQLKALKAHLDSEVKCKNVLLSVPFGYHSTAMEPLLDDLISVAKRVTLRPPTLAVISNVFGEVVRPGDASVFTSEYFARHCAEPVQFERGINAFCATSEFANVGLWVEIGPHPTTLPMLKSNPSVPKDGLLLPSIRKNQDVWLTLMTSLSQLYTTDRSLAWREVFAHVPAVKCVDAPSYPFSPSRFWIDYKEEAPGLVASDRKTLTSSARLVSESSMLHAWAQEPSAANGNVAIFETPIEMLAGSIRGHSVGGMPLCPASVYIEQVLAGVQLAREHLGLGSTGHHLVVKDVQFAHPLVYAEGVARLVKTKITLDDGAESGNFTVSSSVDGAEESVHVHGTFRLETNTKTTTKFGRVAPVIHRQMATVATPVGPGYETFSTRTAYEVIFPRVVDYSREYHTMQSLTVDPSGMEGYAVVKLPADHFRGRFIVHPVFMDTLLHVAGFVANMQGGINDAYICSQVDSVKVIPDLVDNDATYGVFCRNAWLADEGVMLADAYAVELTGAKRIVGHLKGMHFRRVRLTSLKKGLQMASGRPAEVTPSRVTFAPSKPSSHKVVSRTPSSSSTSSSTVHDVQAAVVGIIAETCGIDPANVKLETCLDSLGEPDVKGLLASVLGIPPKEITDDADFDALGLDSLTSIEALQALRTEFGLDLPSNFFQTNSTPKAVDLPLFLVHDGSGLVNYYERLSPLDRNIWGIHNPNFITGQAYDSVVAMASEYADLITKTASGPILLGGWSFGGVAAFEIARQLLRKGVPVKGVLLIDSPSPVNHVPLSQSLIEAVVNLDARGANSDIGRLVKAQFEKNSALLGKYDPVSAGGPFPPLVLLRSREGFNPSGVKEPVPTWLADRSNAQQAVAGWEGLVGATVKSIDIPGNHFEPFHASNIAEVSCRIADGCQYLESL
ncbi:polyketide beta-ketoacyl-synthase [Gloeophyllum trabeum ATCC 11539]|uniref:Polyketide beta-ketoacyl-synthase n=1 Tax=Gloeophyllum trabeum (strain ATCC 11539 / FP-39264 / Madison 617) TaxID=670483 RepID=S7RNP0_GLOTA|nr:polyketide beta-ketoacyl-synthase [Gloeophyllum trabeum ATCC 11539]EPQ54389.1 polyketide beta-ketoacyl-synthase [Gloeophyllum trabeum ATCC 11539]